MSRERASGARGLRPGTLVVLWVLLAGLVAAAWQGLPIYMESLDARIVFRQPDCMDVARDQARATPVEVDVRGDSLEAWTKGCLAERQQELARHADLVGYGTMATLVLMSIILTALILQTAWTRLQGRSEAG